MLIDVGRAEPRNVLGVIPGPDPLPFFAEYPHFMWGQVNYDSEGNCARPTDRAWAELFLTLRATGESVDVTNVPGDKASRLLEVRGTIVETIRKAAYLTALRTKGWLAGASASERLTPSEFLVRHPGLDARMTEADQIRSMFLNPMLAAFDSHAWWGGWKWAGEFSTDMTSGLRHAMLAVERGHGPPDLIAWLQDWWQEPPSPYHRKGVRYALRTLTGRDPETA